MILNVKYVKLSLNLTDFNRFLSIIWKKGNLFISPDGILCHPRGLQNISPVSVSYLGLEVYTTVLD